MPAAFDLMAAAFDSIAAVFDPNTAALNQMPQNKFIPPHLLFALHKAQLQANVRQLQLLQLQTHGEQDDKEILEEDEEGQETGSTNDEGEEQASAEEKDTGKRRRQSRGSETQDVRWEGAFASTQSMLKGAIAENTPEKLQQ